MFNRLQPTLIMEEWGVKVPREPFKRLPANNDFFPSFFQRLNGSRQRAEECCKLLALPTVTGCENKIIAFELHLRCYPVPRLLCLHHFKFLLSQELHIYIIFPAISQLRKCCLSWRIKDSALLKQKMCQQLLPLLVEEVLLYSPLYVQIRFRGQTSAGWSEICCMATTGWTDRWSTTPIPSWWSSTSVLCRSETWYVDNVSPHFGQVQHVWLWLSCFLWIWWLFVEVFSLSLLQDEKNQFLTTNVFLHMVKIPCTFDEFVLLLNPGLCGFSWFPHPHLNVY